jgi:hypothetical protein
VRQQRRRKTEFQRWAVSSRDLSKKLLLVNVLPRGLLGGIGCWLAGMELWNDGFPCTRTNLSVRATKTPRFHGVAAF